MVDFSEAVKWEIKQAIAEETRARTILILPEPKRSEEWYKSWEELRHEVSLPGVDDNTAIVVYPSPGSGKTVSVNGYWRYWGDAVAAAIVYGMKKSTGDSSCLIDFGPRVRGSMIMRAATAIGIIAILVGYVIPLLGIDLLEYSHVDLLGIILRLQ